MVPVNWHLAAAEVAYILADSGAGAFVAHERFGEVAAEAAAGAGIDPEARFAVGKVPGFTPLAALGAGSDGRPDPRTAGAPMVYTSGTSGRPKGVRRPLTGEDPDKPPTRPAGSSASSRSPPATATCTCAARRCTTRRC